MPAKKPVKPKNTIDTKKLDKEIKAKIKKKVDKEKPADKEVSTSKELPQRACIECHFLAEEQKDTEEAGLEPHEIEPKICHYQIVTNIRNLTRKKDFSGLQFPLTCVRECWGREYDKNEQYKKVVEENRINCYLFYPYTEGMGFEAAKEMQDKEQINKKVSLATQQARDNMFIKKTDYWFFSYEGKTGQLTVGGNVGLEYIARLLDNRGREYESHKLRNMVENKTPIDSRDTVKYGKKDEDKEDKKETVDERPKKGFKAIMDDVDVVLDEEAFKEYKDELRELNIDLKEAKENNDLGQIGKIQETIDFINKQMVAAVGRKGRPRKFKIPNETARKAISNSVNRVYKKLEKEHQLLWNHLKKNITISHNCSYSPEKNIDWNIEL